MSTFGILDLVIGLFFIYFVFSVICSSIVEGIAQLLQWRSRELEQWIKDTFSSEQSNTAAPGSSQVDPANTLLQHHLIRGLTHHRKRTDYIPAQLFTSALFDLVYSKFRRENKEAALPETYNSDTFETALRSNPVLLPDDLRRYLLQAIQENIDSDNNLATVKQRFEDWFNAAMDRLSSTYKKKIRSWTLLISLVVATIANVDTIALSKYLKENTDTVGRTIVEVARQATQDSLLYQEAMQYKSSAEALLAQPNNSTTSPRDQIDSTLAKIARSKERSLELMQSLREMSLPLGWEQDRQKLQTIFKREEKAINTTAGENPPHTTPQPPATQPAWSWLLTKLLGILLSALALTVGAPFWFDIINKLVNLRSSGNKPAGSEVK